MRSTCFHIKIECIKYVSVGACYKSDLIRVLFKMNLIYIKVIRFCFQKFKLIKNFQNTTISRDLISLYWANAILIRLLYFAAAFLGIQPQVDARGRVGM